MTSSQHQSPIHQQSRGETNLSFASASPKDLADTTGLLRSNRQGNYVSQTPFLPGALGIGSSSSQSILQYTQKSTASPLGWTLTNTNDTSNSGGGEGSQYNNREGDGSQWTRSKLSSPSMASRESTTLRGHFTSSSNTHLHSLSEESRSSSAMPASVNLSTFEGAIEGSSAATSGSVNSSGGSNTRNFLVPIGSTGARQKLSILSASQRPATSQSVVTEGTQNMTDSALNQRGQFTADNARRRPSTGGDDSRGLTKTLPTPDSTTAKNRFNPSTAIARQGDHAQAGTMAQVRQDAEHRIGQWTVDKTSNIYTSSNQARPSTSPFRSMSQQEVSNQRVAQAFETSIFSHQEGTSLQQKDSRLNRLGMNWRQSSRDGSVKSSEWDGESLKSSQNKEGDRILATFRSSDNLRGMRKTRPASSSSTGKDRAVKIGTGFKSIFGSKSSKDVTTISGNDSSIVHSLYDENDQGAALSMSPTLLNKAQHQKRGQLNGSQNEGYASPPSLNVADSIGQIGVDVNKARNAGWTALPDKAASTKTHRTGNSVNSMSSLSVRNSPNEFGDQVREWDAKSINSSGVAPLLDFDLPITDGFFEEFSSESLFPYMEEKAEEEMEEEGERGNNVPIADMTRSINGLNLRLADQQYASRRDYNKANETSQESSKTFPESASHEKNNITTSFGLTSPIKSNDKGLAKGTFERDEKSATAMSPSSSTESTFSAPNSSRAWSPTKVDRPSVPITSPLLASVLGQHVQSQQQQKSSPLVANVDTIVSPSKHMTSPLNDALSTANSTPIDLPSEWENQPNATFPVSPESKVTSPKTRPDLPIKSRERQISTRLITTALPMEDACNYEKKQVNGDEKKASMTDESSQSNKEKENQASYVPPGALNYTRKGTAVRPGITKTASSERAATLARSNDSTSNQWSTDGGSLLSPQYQSRFSMASSDFASSPHDSMKISYESIGTKLGTNGQIEGNVVPQSNDESGSYDQEDDVGSVDVVNLLPISAWNEVEGALHRFKAMSNPATNKDMTSNDKGALLRSVLLPFLALEAETQDVQVSGPGQFQSGKSRRALFFSWIQQLLLELQNVQTSADRGAILESIACIIESRNFTASMFQSDWEDSNKFYNVFGLILSYAIGELNKKGVYQNTLIFSGRLLAVAFFRIEGVASKLLRALPVNRFAMERVALEIQWENNMPIDWESYKKLFPASLHDFCFQDARSYLKLLDSHISSSVSNDDNDEEDRYLVRQANVEVEMSGNWLRRWQSDDSELFFSFCRSYHRQMAILLMSSNRVINSTITKNYFFGGPGYAHLATCIHQKCLSLVHRDILSVTTISSQKNFNPGETANVLSGSTAGKPRHLEAANRRCTAIVVDIIRAPSASQHHHTFEPMLGIHIKCLIKRTSLYDVQGVFCLLDWLDGVLNHLETAELPIERLVDMEFVIQTIWLLLKDADHALALMRTIAFCYSNFAILTSSRKNRIRFCEEILLHPKIFQKLFLSWSFTIRAYFLHLLVFRLARINDFAQPEDDSKGKSSINIAKLFNQRLDEIRKRHDELSPPASSADSASEDEGNLSRFKSRPQSFVSTIKHTGNLGKKSGSPASMTKAERLLGIGHPDPALSTKGSDSKAQSRAAKWLRALGAKGSTSKTGKQRLDSVLIPGVANWNGSPTIESKISYDGSNGESKLTRKRLASVVDDSESEDESEDERDDVMPTIGEGGSNETTPTGEGAYEFNFEAKPGHHHHQQERQNSQGNNIPPPEFEDEEKAANEHISRKLSFDLQSPISTPPPNIQSLDGGSSSSSDDGMSSSSNSGVKLPIPTPHNNRVSRAFNRRQSLLPGPAYDLVSHDNNSNSEEEDRSNDESMGVEASSQLDLETSNDSQQASSSILAAKRKKWEEVRNAEPYNHTLHVYAIQSLREYEQTVLEHDEFFAKQQLDDEILQVPRLPIQWPAMWSE